MIKDETLKAKIRRYHSLDEQAKALDDEKKKLSAAIKTELEVRGVKKFYTIQIVDSKTTTADTKLLKSAYPAVWAAVQKTTPKSYLLKAKEA